MEQNAKSRRTASYIRYMYSMIAQPGDADGMLATMGFYACENKGYHASDIPGSARQRLTCRARRKAHDAATRTRTTSDRQSVLGQMMEIDPKSQCTATDVHGCSRNVREAIQHKEPYCLLIELLLNCLMPYVPAILRKEYSAMVPNPFITTIPGSHHWNMTLLDTYLEIMTIVEVVDGHGGTEKLGVVYPLQAGKQPPYHCPHELM
nr:hypothetical protein CFP56_21594 [Quercus suber]